MKIFNSPIKKALAILLLLIGSVLLFSKQLIVFYLQPGSTFSLDKAPQAPNYADKSFWAAHPDFTDSSDLRPKPEAPKEKSEADVFFVHPTTYFGPGGWNSDMRLGTFTAQATEHIMATMASVFSDCCDIYSPRYRQAHLTAFTRPDSTASYQALDLAYQDVEKAFQHFLDHRDSSRPFILAGHSQGTLHSIRLLNKYINGKKLQEQMVAAYVIGYWMPRAIFQTTLTDIVVCSDPRMTGCVISYDAYDKTGPGRDPNGKLPYWSPTGWYKAESQDTVCVNPLSWAIDEETVAKEQNFGAVAMAREFSLVKLLTNTSREFVYSSLPTPIPAYTSARCGPDGSLMVDSQDGTAFANPGSGEDKSLHPNDWNLFHMNIRHNVKQRIEAHRSAY